MVSQGPVFPDATPKDRHVGSVEISDLHPNDLGPHRDLNLGVVTMVLVHPEGVEVSVSLLKKAH